MLPKGISDLVGDILDVITQLAPSRNQIISIFERYSHPFAFINEYLRNFPSSSRQVAGVIYRAARYFARQEETITVQPPNQVFDPRLAGEIPNPFDDPLKDYTYRYNIRIDLDSPGLGVKNTFNFWINAPGLLSPREVQDLAAPALVNLVDRYKLTFNLGFPNTTFVTSAEVVGFVRYIPR